jgi:hypothetical protein
MARVKGVPPAQAGLYGKIAYYFTRRAITKLTGRQTARMIEPLEMYAQSALAVYTRGPPSSPSPPGYRSRPAAGRAGTAADHCACRGCRSTSPRSRACTGT